MKPMRFAGMSGAVIFATANKVVRNRNDQLIVVSDEAYIVVMDAYGKSERHEIPYGARLEIEANQDVKEGDVIASWYPQTTPIVAEAAGCVAFTEIVEGQNAARQVDEVTGISRLVIFQRDSQLLNPRLILDCQKRWLQSTPVLPIGAMILVHDLKFVEAGDIIAYWPTGATSRPVMRNGDADGFNF